jgi:hypothetical protein
MSRVLSMTDHSIAVEEVFFWERGVKKEARAVAR